MTMCPTSQWKYIVPVFLQTTKIGLRTRDPARQTQSSRPISSTRWTTWGEVNPILLCKCWWWRCMPALEHSGQMFTTDWVIGKCVRIEFRSNSLDRKRNWMWGSHFNVCFDIMKTTFSSSISKQRCSPFFLESKVPICWIPRAQMNHYVWCVLWDTPKPMEIHQEQKAGAAHRKCGFAPE